MDDKWEQLKETILELRDNGGICNQHEVCSFLYNYMNILEKESEEEVE